MKTQTSLVAQQVRLQQWAEQIKDCQSRPVDMNVDVWCNQNGITKANYYYRLRCVREACLAASQNETSFAELPAQKTTTSLKHVISKPAIVATLHGSYGISIEITSDASPEMVRSLLGALAYVK